MILAGDVGGNKTLLGLFRRVDGRLRPFREALLSSRDYSSLEALIRSFLDEGGERVLRCALGVAAPIVDGRGDVVNLPWRVRADRLETRLGLRQLRFLNDVEATAWGIPELPAGKIVSLTPGLRSRGGNAAVIAAGTGLGTALLIRRDGRYLPCPGEGGHQEFGPRSDLEIDLLRFLRRRHGRVSVERAVSGPALDSIYEFLIESGRGRSTGRMRRRLEESPDSHEAIARAGMEGEDATAGKALDLFVSLYGAVAGDLALAVRATGGIFVGGGIAPKLLPRLKGGDFVRSFRDKGRLTPLMERIPIRVILEPRTALLGAACYAALGMAERNRGWAA